LPHTWAKATTANSSGSLIELDASGHCMFLSGDFTSNSFLKGVKNLRLMTIVQHCLPLQQDIFGCHARIAAVNTGATSVTLLHTTLCSRRTASVAALFRRGVLFAIIDLPMTQDAVLKLLEKYSQGADDFADFSGSRD
jgi:hypothetical protein